MQLAAHLTSPLTYCCLVVLLSACGGGGGGVSSLPPAGPTDAQRQSAAASTAQNHAACQAIAPFYWEVGDRLGARGSGSITSTADPTVYSADTVMNIASASKWLYGAYVVEQRGTALSATDIAALNFTSGYTSFSTCLPGQSVQGCVDFLNNGAYTAANAGRFAYGGGHMQVHAASAMGLGALFNDGLAGEVRSRLGTDIALTYSQPQPAGGGVSSGTAYARFLRRLLDGTYRLGSQLGTHAVCASTDAARCTLPAINSPMPTDETMHYALGHWVEDDPVKGDGAFSSAGAFGFYPWIDASRSWYGLVVRHTNAAGEQDGVASMYCGRVIRKAWITAAAVP